MHQAIDQQPVVDEGAEEQRLAVLNALGASMAAKRSDAVAYKSTCGIETEWTGDEEFYQGYDDANRHDHRYHFPGLHCHDGNVKYQCSHDFPRTKIKTCILISFLI